MLKSSPLPILPIISFSCFLLFYCKVKAKAEVKAFLTSTCFSLLIGISHSIIDIEVACWCYKPVSLNPCFLLKGLVVIDYQLPNLVPHSYPHLIACLIVFKMDYPSVVSHLPALRLFLGMMFLEGADASLYLFIRIQGMVHPHMIRLWMGLNKQTASAKGFYFPYNLPCMLRMALRVTAPRNNRCLPQVWCGTNRAKFRVMMSGNNRRNPGLRVIFACIICI